MQGLSLTFKALTVCGCWRPKEYSSSFNGILYTAYTIFLLLMVFSSTLCQLMDVILNVDNADDFVENSYMMLSMVISTCKMASLLLNRRNIALLYDALDLYPLKGNDDEEMEIRDRFDRVIGSNTVSYAVLITSSVSWMSLSSYFTDYRKKRLMFRAWLPFDCSTSAVFSAVYIYQILGLIIGAYLHIVTDALLCAFLTIVFCQFEILEHRLKKATTTMQNELQKCVQHHVRIYQYATMINSTFKVTICIQFFVSTMVVCFTLFRLVTLKSLNTTIFQMIFYMACILTQIFLYCWYGNEVKIKSLQTSRTVFSLEWTHLSVSSKKALMMIMRRATIPIEFTSAHIITMNLDSFVNLLKTSYTAYNLLQQTQEN